MRLTLLSKRDCHLCEAARQALQALERKFSLEWEERELSQGDPLFERFRLEFPVILREGEPLCAGRIDAQFLSDILSRLAGPREGMKN